MNNKKPFLFFELIFLKLIFLVAILIIILNTYNIQALETNTNIQEANYYIIDSKVLAEINFGNVKNFEFPIPYDSKALEVTSDSKTLEVSSDYIIEDQEFNKLIKINSASNLTIKLISETYLDKSGENYFFVIKNQFNYKILRVYLPESAIINKNIGIFPEPDLKTTDGRRIILEWNDFNGEQILVSYEFLEKNKTFYFFIIAVIVICFIIFYIIQRNKFTKKLKEIKKKSRKEKVEIKEEELTKNLFEDERIIVNYLLNKKDNQSWTKDIIRDLQISKVKLSRKLRSLEQKEIVKKTPYGNENMIILIKRKK